MAANLGRKATKDLLTICQSSICLTEDKVLRQKILDNGRLCIKSYKELLETIHALIQKPSNEIKQKLLHHSRAIAQTIQELVQCAQQLKGQSRDQGSRQSACVCTGILGSESADPDDPTCIAENELFNAAQSIESAAKKLSLLKPRRRVQVRDSRVFECVCGLD